jgi:hypothetical protein
VIFIRGFILESLRGGCFLKKHISHTLGYVYPKISLGLNESGMGRDNMIFLKSDAEI